MPHKGQQAAPQAPRYWSILLIMGVRKPTVASPRCHQKPPGAYKPNSRRQQHYTGACPSVDLLVIIIESFYVCCVMAECHEVLWLYDNAMSIPANSARHVAGRRVAARVRRAPCPRLVVRACADTRARTNKGAGGSEGARARVDRAAQVAISGGRAHSGATGSGSSTGVTKLW